MPQGLRLGRFQGSPCSRKAQSKVPVQTYPLPLGPGFVELAVILPCVGGGVGYRGLAGREVRRRLYGFDPCA